MKKRTSRKAVAAASFRSAEASMARAFPTRGGTVKVPAPQGCFLNVTNLQGELIERIDVTDYDLSRPLARASLIDGIISARLRAMPDEE